MGLCSPTTVTNGDGEYSFDNLIPGDYQIEVIRPSGHTFTSYNQGSDEGVDSDVNPESNLMDIGTVTSGINNTNSDAGLTELSSLGDMVWYDANRDGIQNGNETGVPGVTVILLGANESRSVKLSLMEMEIISLKT